MFLPITPVSATLWTSGLHRRWISFGAGLKLNLAFVRCVLEAVDGVAHEEVDFDRPVSVRAWSANDWLVQLSLVSMWDEPRKLEKQLGTLVSF